MTALPRSYLHAAQAYDAILKHASPPLRDRSEEAARRALECAQALIGNFQGESFGWNRRQKREGLLDDQLAILWFFAREDIAPGDSIGQGGEHEVWHFKATGISVIGACKKWDCFEFKPIPVPLVNSTSPLAAGRFSA